MRTLAAFDQWREVQRQLHRPEPQRDRLLIIRLDDIGDYLLFRNQLGMYRRSARWGTHLITLLGNASWKPLFDEFDAGTVDDVLWVDKARYLESAPYRLSIWAQLRGRGFETVIAPSRTRPLLLDDLCRLAAAPLHSFGAVNTYEHSDWNRVSDGLYEKLFSPADTQLHEFFFNAQFSTWICGAPDRAGRPELDAQHGRPHASPPAADAGVICFLGANTRSRRWPAKRWIEFIRLLGTRYPGKVILAGNGSAEQAIAANVQADTGAESIVGRVSLVDLVQRVAAARAVVSNDTMAAHLGVSCHRPTVIIANGVNYERFTDYAVAGVEDVATVYPRVFTRRRARDPRLRYRYTDALTADIASIAADDVLLALDGVLRSGPPPDVK